MKKALIMFSMVLFGMCLVGCNNTLDGYKYKVKTKIDIDIDSMKSSDYVLENRDKITNVAREYKLEIDNCTRIEDIDIIYSKCTKKLRGMMYSMVGEEKYTNGNGTEISPYVVDTVGKLIYFSNQINNGKDINAYFELGADIDLEYIEWMPIGIFSDSCFNGVFDGNGYEIKNLTISKRYPHSDAENIGLFGYNTGMIKNLGITNIDIRMTWCNAEYELSVCVGGLVGYNMGCIENCYTIGNIDLEYTSGDNKCVQPAHIKTGGLVGPNGGKLNGCYSAVDVSVNYSGRHVVDVYAGGLASYYKLYYGSSSSSHYDISNCFVTGSVSVEHSFISSYCEEFFISATPVENCYVYNGQMSREKPEENGDYDYFCTTDELNDINFYINKLGWNQNVWNLEQLNFSNGKYLDDKYPKLNKK